MNRLYNLRASFKYALNGIGFCVRYEKNMRIHITVTAYVLFFSGFYELQRAEILLLILICVVVMALEMVNTAIEVVVDKVSPSYHTLAKIAKDVAAGAVLFASIAAVLVGVVLFWDIAVFQQIWAFFTGQISSLMLLLASGAVSVIFIRSGKKRKTRGKIDEHNK